MSATAPLFVPLTWAASAPDDVLLLVFESLPRAFVATVLARVCRAWRHVATHRFPWWRHLVAEFGSLDVLSVILPRHPYSPSAVARCARRCA